MDGRTTDWLTGVGARDTCVSQNGSYETWLLFRRTISHYPFFKRNMIAKMDHIIEFRSQCSSMQMTPSAHRLNFPKTHLRNRSDLNWAQFMELRWWASYAIVKQWSSVSGWEKYCWWTFLHQNETQSLQSLKKSVGKWRRICTSLKYDEIHTAWSDRKANEQSSWWNVISLTVKLSGSQKPTFPTLAPNLSHFDSSSAFIGLI